jgi:hypothetical protein
MLRWRSRVVERSDGGGIIILCPLYRGVPSRYEVWGRDGWGGSISILNFFPPNRGVDFYFEFLPTKSRSRFFLFWISSRQNDEFGNHYGICRLFGPSVKKALKKQGVPVVLFLLYDVCHIPWRSMTDLSTTMGAQILVLFLRIPTNMYLFRLKDFQHVTALLVRIRTHPTSELLFSDPLPSQHWDGSILFNSLIKQLSPFVSSTHLESTCLVIVDLSIVHCID